MSELISRADAICEVLVNDGIDNIVDRINELPSADAYTEQQVRDAFNSGYSCGMEQTKEAQSADAVQGEWIDVENEPYCECSVCGAYIDNLDDDYAFCPRCGARMKGGEDE